MTPTLLGRALAACLGLGAVDVLALNLLARPVQPPLVLAVRPEGKVAALAAPQPSRLVMPPLPAPSLQLEPARPAVSPALILEFDASVHWLNGRALHALKGMLEQLRSARQVTVVGHADVPGPAELNERLSAARAEAVARRLAHAGIEREHMRVIWSGAREPRIGGESRRVEIYLEPAP